VLQARYEYILLAMNECAKILCHLDAGCLKIQQQRDQLSALLGPSRHLCRQNMSAGERQGACC